jgi:hypothetical protein
VPKNDPLDIGQSETGTLKLFLTMQALKDAKKLVRLIRVKASPVISNKDNFLGVTVRKVSAITSNQPAIIEITQPSKTA